MLTAKDVPANGFGIYPHIKDQPVLAEREARFRGEAVAAVIGTRAAIEALDEARFPVTWQALQPVLGLDAALPEGAPLVQAEKTGNLLLDGGVKRGNVTATFPECAAVAEATFETPFVEHAYIEHEPVGARRNGRLESTSRRRTVHGPRRGSRSCGSTRSRCA